MVERPGVSARVPLGLPWPHRVPLWGRASLRHAAKPGRRRDGGVNCQERPQGGTGAARRLHGAEGGGSRARRGPTFWQEGGNAPHCDGGTQDQVPGRGESCCGQAPARGIVTRRDETPRAARGGRNGRVEPGPEGMRPAAAGGASGGDTSAGEIWPGSVSRRTDRPAFRQSVVPAGRQYRLGR